MHKLDRNGNVLNFKDKKLMTGYSTSFALNYPSSNRDQAFDSATRLKRELEYLNVEYKSLLNRHRKIADHIRENVASANRFTSLIKTLSRNAGMMSTCEKWFKLCENLTSQNLSLLTQLSYFDKEIETSSLRITQKEMELATVQQKLKSFSKQSTLAGSKRRRGSQHLELSRGR